MVASAASVAEAGLVTDLPARLRGLGLELRLPVAADVDAIVAACQDPDIARWTAVPSPYGVDQAVAWLEVAVAQHEAGTDLGFLAFDADGGLVGSVGAKSISWSDCEAEVGYWVAPWARRRGVAGRAVQTLSAWLLRAGIARLEALVIVGNTPSERVLAGVGFHREGVLRSVAAGGCGDGLDRIDVSVWSLIPSDPGAVALSDLDVTTGEVEPS